MDKKTKKNLKDSVEKLITFRAMTESELRRNRCKAYLTLDQPENTSKTMTHYYLNRIGKEVKCYIQAYDEKEKSYIVTNENGFNIYLLEIDLIKI